MSGVKLIATTRPVFWEPSCTCRSAGYSLNATRIFRANGKAVGPKGERHAAPIVRVETIPGPSCDRCGRAWLNLMRETA